jgi:hypothetical protein
LARQVRRLDGSRGTPLGPSRGQAHRQDGQVLRPRRRRAVEARHLRHPAAVHPHPRGARAPAGHPRWDLWPSRRAPHPRWQCFPPRLLLAYRGRGCQRDCAHLRRVPVLRPQVQPSRSCPADHPHNMAVRRVGG